MELTPAGCKDEHLFMCSKLYTAAFEGRTEEVTGLLTGSGSVALPARKFRTAQSNANHHGPCTAQELTAERSTLLHIAAGQGHTGLIAELYYRERALLSSLNSALDTPLHCAARAGHADAVDAIVRLARDNVEEDRLSVVLCGKNEAGDTALHLAARHGHCAAAERLVKLAPEMAMEVNGAGVSPLYLAVMSGSVRAVQAIISWCECRASAAGPTSQNALHAAVLQNSEMVSLLLRWRPELAGNLDINKSSPLHFASSDGDCSIIEEIVAYAPPNTTYLQDSDGLSALHAAALMGNTAAVRLLLQCSPASADLRDNHGRSFIHVAAMKGCSSVVKFVVKDDMLEHLLNMQDKEGNTPLHLAVVKGEGKVVSMLLSNRKVEAHIMNNAGHTPSDLVEISSGFFTMINLVVKLYVHGAQFRPQRQDHIEKWNGQDLMKWRETASKNLAIVSTLVATVAFQAAFNMPGSYGSDGEANLEGDRLYTAFVVLDTVAVTTSVMATILLVYGRASRSHRSWLGFMIAMHFLWLSLNSMLLGFFAAIAAVMTKKQGLRIALSQVMYTGLYLLTTVLTYLATPGSLGGVLQFSAGSCLERRRRAKRRITRQFPFVMVYAYNVIVFMVVNTLALSAMNTSGNVRW